MRLFQVDIAKEWQLSGEAGKGGFGSLGALITNLLPKILLFGSIVAFIIVIIAGIGVISGAGGGGDAHGAENRKQVLTYAVIGLLIMFGSYWILQIINFVTQGSLKGIL